MKVIDLIPSFASLFFTLALAILLCRRQRFKHFPLFTIYISYSIVATSLRVLTMREYPIFFKVFWWSEFAYLILALTAVYGSFAATFRAFFALWWVRLAFPSVLLISAGYSTLKGMAYPPAAPKVIALIIGMEIGFQYAIVGSLVLFFFLVLFLQTSNVKSHFGIVCGFAVAALGVLASTLVFSEFGTRFPFLMKYLASIAYIGALLIWLVSVSTPLADQQSVGDEVTARIALRELRTYRAALRKTQR